MKKIRKLLLVTLAAALCALLLTGCGEKEVSVSVTLVNHSEHDISSISITPSTSTEWDTEFVDGTFADGESFSAGLGTYKESEVPDTYNILVYNDENYIQTRSQDFVVGSFTFSFCKTARKTAKCREFFFVLYL